jgi:dCMP deaminase
MKSNIRPTMYDTYAEIVRALAKRSTCSARAAVGALLYDNDHRVIATGYNGSPRGFKHCDDVGCEFDEGGKHCINSIHAEENALLQCAAIGRSTTGLMIFTTHFPCWRCALRLVQAGIFKVTYIDEYGSDVQKTINMLNSYGILVDRYYERRT